MKEQRVCIKYCFKLERNAMETLRLLKLAFREQAVVFQIKKQCDLSVEGC